MWEDDELVFHTTPSSNLASSRSSQLCEDTRRGAFDRELHHIIKELRDRLGTLFDMYENRTSNFVAGIRSSARNANVVAGAPSTSGKLLCKPVNSSSRKTALSPPRGEDEVQEAGPSVPVISAPMISSPFMVIEGDARDAGQESQAWRSCNHDDAKNEKHADEDDQDKIDQNIEIRSLWVEAPTEAHRDVIATCGNLMKFDVIGGSKNDRRTTPKVGKVGTMESISSEVYRGVRKTEQHIRKVRPRLSCNTLHPVSPVRLAWCAITLGLIVSDLVLIPLLAFNVGTSGADFARFDWICTMYWTFDIIVSFRTGYFVRATVERSPKKIAIQYARTWLAFDMVIVVFEWLQRFIDGMGPSRLMRTTRFIRAIRLMKLLRLAKLREMMRELERQINSNVLYLLWQMSYLTTILLFGVHINTCIWFALGKSSSDGWQSYDVYVKKGDDESGHTPDFAFWYVAASRWVISQLNGRTDVDERRNMRERAFTVFSGIFFAIVGQAIFISLITKKMLELADLFKDRNRRRRMVNDYLNNWSLPAGIVRTIKMQVREETIDTERNKENAVLALLPPFMQAELLFQIRSPFFYKRPIFKVIAEKFITVARKICRHVMRPVYAEKFDIVFDMAEPCQRMLCMTTGHMIYGLPAKVGDAESKLMSNATLGSIGANPQISAAYRINGARKATTDILRGSWLSEAALWVNWVNRGRLMANRNSQLFEIDSKDLAEAVAETKDVYAILVVYAQKFRESLLIHGLSDLVTFDMSVYMESSGEESGNQHF